MEEKWLQTNEECTMEDIEIVENKLGIIFPSEFKIFMLKYHGSYALIDTFDTEKEKGKEINNFLSFDAENKNTYILYSLENIQDRLPKNVIPFAETPGGDFICFGYSVNLENPTIIYWDHELGYEDAENSTCYVARDFDSFIESLYSMDDE